MRGLLKLSELPYFEKWIILGFIIGIFIGLSAIAFDFLYRLFYTIFLIDILHLSLPKPLNPTFSYTVNPLLILVVTFGGLISGLLTMLSPEASGGGVDFAIKAYHNRGKIRKRVAFIELFSSSILLGTGGSAGDLGPMGLIGASIASLITEVLGLTPEDIRKAIAIGIGSGIGVIFKAPIGGALLSAEILYRRDFESEVILPSMISSATAYSIYGLYSGFQPIFGIYPYTFSPLRLPLYAILGILIGLTTILFVRIYHEISNMFRKMKVPQYVKTTLGSFLSSILLLFLPELIGTGYGWDYILEAGKINEINTYGIPLLLFLLLIAVAKMISSSFTIGSGGSGGIEAPSFEIGALIGAIVGIIFHNLFPSIVPFIAPFVIIGMLALFGAGAKAPISVMIIVTEMTYSLQLLPGEMVAVAIAYVISGKHTLYPSQFPTRKESPVHRSEYEIPVMLKVKIRQCKLQDVKINPDEKVEKVIELMKEYGLTSMPVVDKNSTFIGIVFYQSIEGKEGRIGDYVIRGVPTVSLNSNLEDAWEVIARTRSSYVIVTEGEKFIGIVSLEEMLKCYEKRIKRKKE
ncbi:chloride channel protein [Sulfurisphaera javensis]|uniref:Chloride channel protein n=1 Tax=Sulfurisphaera javensis TaxID=2049879 RepID=A0AAT9GPQ7_9CREN